MSGGASGAEMAEAHRALGLTDAEYERICALMEREPNRLELAIFSLMWSEHCAYKYSRKLLERLPTEGEGVVAGPGENAGAVDLGDGVICAFKVESHNHPSAVEPFEGAATGVGGILRDVFALGARPIAILDSLRFGELSSRRSRYLLERAVAGIGHYGNSIGVPTVGGEVYFEPAYEHNCLVNAMCVGLVEGHELLRSAASGPGNALILLGAATGRDGIGGASVLASAELGEADHAKRPSVQIGDPFEEKRLMECCLALRDRGLLVALQDLGAAGLSSSSSEMASKGGVGLDIDVARVHLREDGMEPWEIMISESQERMLAVVEPDRVEEVLAVCRHFDVRAGIIGEVTGSRRLRVMRGGERVADIPVEALVDRAPAYDLDPVEPDAPAAAFAPRLAVLAGDADPERALLAILGSANCGSRAPIFEQYDHIVQGRTARRPGEADAAVLKLDESGRALALAIDGNGRRVAADPYRGAAEAVLECARNLACAGAEPAGLTNCLNFGNPEKPHVAWQLDRAVSGIAHAATALGVPVVGGNVSLYNEGASGPIYPTPVIGMVGVVADLRRVPAVGFAKEGDAVGLVGPFMPSLNASELESLRGRLRGPLPQIDFQRERELISILRDAVNDGLIRSAHDVSDGGIAAAAAECAIAAGLGCELDLSPLAPRAGGCEWTTLFGEGSGGVIVSGERDALLELSSRASGVGFLALGRVGGDAIAIAAPGATMRVSVAYGKGEFDDAIARWLR